VDVSLYDVLQGAIVGGAILVSAVYALGRIAPNLRKRCATWLTGSTQPRWLQYIGGKLETAAIPAAAADRPPR
jgi:hypothetical protein